MGGFAIMAMYKTKPDLNKIKEVVKNFGQIKPSLGDSDNEIAIDVEIKNKESINSIRLSSFDDDDVTEEELTEVKNKLGFTPQFQICIQTWSNQLENHKNVINLVNALFTIQETYIDICAAYDPNLTSSKDKIRKSISKIKGNYWELDYETASGKYWFTHAMDEEFFKNLTSLSNFRFPK